MRALALASLISLPASSHVLVHAPVSKEWCSVQAAKADELASTQLVSCQERARCGILLGQMGFGTVFIRGITTITDTIVDLVGGQTGSLVPESVRVPTHHTANAIE